MLNDTPPDAAEPREPCKLLVFGATGRTGRLVVEQALERGHTVTAYVRNAAKMNAQHERLRVVEGDVLGVGTVGETVPGHDAVLSAIGPGKAAPPDLVTRHTRIVLDAMQKHGVRRLVLVSGAGAGAGANNRTMMGRFMKWFVGTMIPAAYKDKENQLRLLEESDVDWTALRPGRLIDTPVAGKVRAGDIVFRFPPNIAHADLAMAMLDAVEEGRFLRAAPFVQSARE